MLSQIKTQVYLKKSLCEDRSSDTEILFTDRSLVFRSKQQQNGDFKREAYCLLSAICASACTGQA